VWNDMLNLNANIMSYTSVAGSIRFIAIVPTAYFSTSGTIFTMNFHVKENVAIGTDLPLGIDIREFFVSPIGGTEAQIPYAVTNGVIHVNCLPGDVNGDGVVNSMDIIIIMRYALGINNLNASQLIAADYNGDGQVNASDALMMMRISLGIA
ncbi:MAG: dockerin type I repeat-containing protein, partial [Clostridia bacterium]|nr:dockerin type I repeat-containing protein [Clostridia bacterium]